MTQILEENQVKSPVERFKQYGFDWSQDCVSAASDERNKRSKFAVVKACGKCNK